MDETFYAEVACEEGGRLELVESNAISDEFNPDEAALLIDDGRKVTKAFKDVAGCLEHIFRRISESWLPADMILLDRAKCVTDALDEAALISIFMWVSQLEGPPVLSRCQQVCTRWRAVLYADPRPWESAARATYCNANDKVLRQDLRRAAALASPTATVRRATGRGWANLCRKLRTMEDASWARLRTDAGPTRRGFFACVSTEGERQKAQGCDLLVFGGYDPASHRRYFSEVWGIRLADEGVSDTEATWHRFAVAESGVEPQPRCHADVVYFDGRLFVHGGLFEEGFRFNDTWAFDLATATWTCLEQGGQEAAQQRLTPCARYHHATCRVGTSWMLHGGHDWKRNTLRDMWVLNLDREAQDTRWKLATLSEAGGEDDLKAATAFHRLLPTSEASFLLTEGEELQAVHEFGLSPDGEQSPGSASMRHCAEWRRWDPGEAVHSMRQDGFPAVGLVTGPEGRRCLSYLGEVDPSMYIPNVDGVPEPQRPCLVLVDVAESEGCEVPRWHQPVSLTAAQRQRATLSTLPTGHVLLWGGHRPQCRRDRLGDAYHQLGLSESHLLAPPLEKCQPIGGEGGGDSSVELTGAAAWCQKQVEQAECGVEDDRLAFVAELDQSAQLVMAQAGSDASPQCFVIGFAHKHGTTTSPTSADAPQGSQTSAETEAQATGGELAGATLVWRLQLCSELHPRRKAPGKAVGKA